MMDQMKFLNDKSFLNLFAKPNSSLLDQTAPSARSHVDLSSASVKPQTKQDASFFMDLSREMTSTHTNIYTKPRASLSFVSADDDTPRGGDMISGGRLTQSSIDMRKVKNK